MRLSKFGKFVRCYIEYERPQWYLVVRWARGYERIPHDKEIEAEERMRLFRSGEKPTPSQVDFKVST
jgi:hypothetical protein